MVKVLLMGQSSEADAGDKLLEVTDYPLLS